MKYNCCQQSDLCPKNKTCKPFNSPAMPWKRFTCECPDGYHGDNCDEPIRSCGGYLLDVPRESGIYKIVDSYGSEYKVYCHFDSDAAWTLVQSYSYANGSYNGKLPELRKPIKENQPVSENAITWSGYRLSKPRMKSIQNDSAFLQFTCDYEKNLAINKSDFIQVRLRNIKTPDENVDVFEFNGETPSLIIGDGRGKIGKHDLSHCEIKLRQGDGSSLHVHFKYVINDHQCTFTDSCSWNNEYFGYYVHNNVCGNKAHSCVQNDNSTTQLWFGMRYS